MRPLAEQEMEGVGEGGVRPAAGATTGAFRGWLTHDSDGVLGAVVRLAGGTAAVQMIGIAAAPLTARVFAPSEAGIAAVFTNVLAVTTGLACLQYDQALPLPRTRAERIQVLLLCVLVAFGTAALALVAVVAGRHHLSAVLREPRVTDYLWLLPLGILVAGTSQALARWHTREGSFRRIVGARWRQSLAQVPYQLVVGVLTKGSAWALVSGALVGHAAASVSYLRGVQKELRATRSRTPLAALGTLALQYRRFPIYGSWSVMIDSFSPTVPFFVLTALHGAETAGWYRMAQSLVLLPVAAISGAVSSVYLGTAPRLALDDPPALNRLYLRLTSQMAVLGLLLVAGCSLLPFLVPVVLGARWAPSGAFGVALSVSAAFSLMAAPATNLILLRRNHWEAAWVVLRLALLGVAAWVAQSAALSPVMTVVLFAGALAACYVVLVVLNLVAIGLLVSGRSPVKISEDP